MKFVLGYGYEKQRKYKIEYAWDTAIRKQNV